MAKRKRKSTPAVAVDDGDTDEAAENATNETLSPAPARRPRKGPRPSVEFVEISSDEDDDEEQERFGGVLRGLNPKNVIPAMQPSIETNDAAAEGVVSTQAIRHGTRQSHYGKTETNYSMKYHPMDEVTRPKRAAQHRRSTSALRDDHAETDEETLPSSARHSDASDESEEDESSGEDSREMTRAPDPKATRQSTRPSKAKTVNYSAKHHPQDFALPGFQHKARRQKKALKQATRGHSSASKSTESPLNAIDPTNEEATDAESIDDGAMEGEAMNGGPEPDGAGTNGVTPERTNPRKRLRVLGDDRDRGNGSKSKKTKATMGEVKNDLIPLSDSMNEIVRTGIEASRHLIEQMGGLSSSQAHNTERCSDDGGFMPMDHSDAPENNENEPNKENQVSREATAETRRDSFDVLSSKHISSQLLVPYPLSSDFEEQLAVTERRNTVLSSEHPTHSQANHDALPMSDRKREAAENLQSTDARDARPKDTIRSSRMPSTQRSDLSPDKSAPENIASNTGRRHSFSTSITSLDASHQEPRKDAPSKHAATGMVQQHLTNEVHGNNLIGPERRSFAESGSEMSGADLDDNLLSTFNPSP